MGYRIGNGLADHRTSRALRAGDFQAPLHRGLGFYGQSELEADQAKAKALLSDIEKGVQVGRGVFAEIQSSGISQAVADATPLARTLDQAAEFVRSSQTTIEQMVPPAGFYSAMWLGSQAPVIQGIVAKASSTSTEVKRAAQLLAEVRDAAGAAQRQAALAEQEAERQRQIAAARQEAERRAGEAQAAADSVSQAILVAQSLAGSGNFAGALAALQEPSVVAAARAIGREGELRSAVAAVTGQQRAIEEAQRREQAAVQAAAEARTEAARLAAEERAERARQEQERLLFAERSEERARAERQAQIEAERIRAQAQLEAQARREEMELRLAQMREEREAAAAERAAAAAQQATLLQTLPLLLERFVPPSSVGAPAGPSPEALALIEALSKPGTDVIAALAQALQARMAPAPPPEPVAAPQPFGIPRRDTRIWGAERF